jgi:hypothetical protein
VLLKGIVTTFFEPAERDKLVDGMLSFFADM